MSANGDPRPDLSEMAAVREQPGIRLDSWKEIASYLIRSERTVRRWEDTEELPVHRQLHEKRGSVYAYTGELDAWRQSRRLPEQEGSDPPERLLPPLKWDPAPRATERQYCEYTESRHRHSCLVSPGWRQVLVVEFPCFAWRAFGDLCPSGKFRGDQSQRLPLCRSRPTPGNEVQPSLSPDGNEVAFAYNDGHSSNYHIVVKAIGSDEPVRFTSDSTDDRSPSWSPDGQTIAFLRFDSDQSARVMTIPSIGGAAETARNTSGWSKAIRDSRFMVSRQSMDCHFRFGDADISDVTGPDLGDYRGEEKACLQTSNLQMPI